MLLEESILLYRELAQKIAELEQQKQKLGREILAQMESKTLSVAGCTVRRYDRLSIKTSVEEARKFHATKMEEVLDKERLKVLHETGEPISGISLIQWIQVSVDRRRSKNPSINGEDPFLAVISS